MKKIKGLLYCTKEKKQKDLLWSNNLKHFFLDGAYNRLIDNLPKYLLNGKIVAECDFEVEEIEKIYGSNHACFDKDGYFDDYADYVTKSLEETELLKHSCLTSEELENYLQDKNGYAIHISNLKIFDEPKGLDDFNKIIETTYGEEPDATITRAPQNMMRCCYEKKPKEWEKGVLISIQPQWLCKILNGEQTILIKKQVLNCMKGNK